MPTTKRFVIISTSELSLIDFEQVLDTSADSVRRSIDGTKCVIKWDGQMPSSVLATQTKSQEFDLAGILAELEKPEWNPVIEGQ